MANEDDMYMLHDLEHPDDALDAFDEAEKSKYFDHYNRHAHWSKAKSKTACATATAATS